MNSLKHIESGRETSTGLGLGLTVRLQCDRGAITVQIQCNYSANTVRIQCDHSANTVGGDLNTGALSPNPKERGLIDTGMILRLPPAVGAGVNSALQCGWG